MFSLHGNAYGDVDTRAKIMISNSNTAVRVKKRAHMIILYTDELGNYNVIM